MHRPAAETRSLRAGLSNKLAGPDSAIDELTSARGLVTSETIPAMRASAGQRQRGGTRLATPHLPGRGRHPRTP